MAVFRIAKTKDYTIMSNFHLRDRTLTLKAKGLLSQMLSLPEDWNYEKNTLCEEITEYLVGPSQNQIFFCRL